MTISERVMQIVAGQTGNSLEKIKPESNIVDDLDADSLDTVEIVMAVEEEFEIEIADEDGEGFTTPQKIIDYLIPRLPREN